MRWQLSVMVIAVLGFIGLDLAFGQSPLQMFGGLGSLFGKESHPDPITLLRNPEVKKELRLTENDSNKVDLAIWKALKEVLDEDQFRRLKQIDLQQRDYKAFGDPIVQDELKLDSQQKISVNRILADSDKQIQDQVNNLQQGLGGGNWGAFGPSFERIKALGKETKDNCVDVLTPAQRRLWQEMVGEEFKMPAPAFDLSNFKLDLKGFDQKNFKGKGKKG